MAKKGKYMSKLIYVNPEGNPYNCRLVLVGEAPGCTEEQEGRPFVGKCGKFVRDTFKNFGFEEEEIYFTNAVKVRPEDNRKPDKAEIESWSEVLDKEIQTIKTFNKDVKILALGRSAEWALKCVDCEFHHIWHPSYVMRFNRENKWIENIKVLLNMVDKK